ncbi:MAG: hypothetical protein H7A39_03515 [Chlamydiales bacterium]|nr:hypothetical protein [Chlamydiales bacterium]
MIFLKNVTTYFQPLAVSRKRRNGCHPEQLQNNDIGRLPVLQSKLVLQGQCQLSFLIEHSDKL